MAGEHRPDAEPEYRSFLLQIGDGGDGPGLYLRSLGAPLDDSVPWAVGDIHRDPNDPNSPLAEPFHHSDACCIDPSYADLHTTAGALYLFDQGDAMWDLLVVTGSCAGQIWVDRLTDMRDYVPRRICVVIVSASQSTTAIGCWKPDHFYPIGDN